MKSTTTERGVFVNVDNWSHWVRKMSLICVDGIRKDLYTVEGEWSFERYVTRLSKLLGVHEMLQFRDLLIALGNMRDVSSIILYGSSAFVGYETPGWDWKYSDVDLLVVGKNASNNEKLPFLHLTYVSGFNDFPINFRKRMALSAVVAFKDDEGILNDLEKMRNQLDGMEDVLRQMFRLWLRKALVVNGFLSGSRLDVEGFDDVPSEWYFEPFKRTLNKKQKAKVIECALSFRPFNAKTKHMFREYARKLMNA